MAPPAAESASDTEELPAVHALRHQIPHKIGPYELRGTVGEGEFSVVKLAFNLETNCYYACKVLERARLRERGLDRRFETEIRVHQQLRHPGIVSLIDLLYDPNFYFVFLEFCPGGEIFQFIVDAGCLGEAEARPILRQIFEAVAYIHSIGVSHRDLKPENLLLDRVGNPKLSDFGMARFLGQDGLVSTPCGSPCYASPECLSSAPYDGRTTDCWSLGVITYAMMTEELPWTKRNRRQLFNQIRRGDYTIPETLSPICRSFVRSPMIVDPARRSTAAQALQHEFLSGTGPPLRIVNELPNVVITTQGVDEFSRQTQLELPVTAEEVTS
jgi:serine/threonine protein kinase